MVVSLIKSAILLKVFKTGFFKLREGSIAVEFSETIL